VRAAVPAALHGSNSDSVASFQSSYHHIHQNFNATSTGDFRAPSGLADRKSGF